MKSSLIWMRDEMRGISYAPTFPKATLSYPTYIVVNIFYLLLWETRLDFHMREHHALPQRERERESHVTLSPHLTLLEGDWLPWQLLCFQSPQGLEWPTWNTHAHEECKYIAIYIYIYIYIYMTWLLVGVFVRFYCLWFFAFVFRFL